MIDPVIQINHVSKTYQTNTKKPDLKVLQNINLEIKPGSFVCIIGPSGCGKSTLLNIIAGFVFPTDGFILFKDKKNQKAGPERGFVFQDPTLFPWLTIYQNIEFGLRNMQISDIMRKEKVNAMIHLTGLEGFENAYPHMISGGMRQRVALARVIALEPELLLMDEPFCALDANSRERLQDELLRIWEKNKRTILFVTHNVTEAAYLADQVIVMEAAPGRIKRILPVCEPRPRNRLSDNLAGVEARLRHLLDNMPCCVPLNSSIGIKEKI